VIREGTLDDLGAATVLLNRAWPHRVGSERGHRHAISAEPPEAHRRFWAAEDGGALVGWATASIDYESSKRPGFVQVCVAAESRRAGLGTALLERCERHLAGFELPLTLSYTTPEEAAQAFAAAHGFRHTHTIRISGVDPRSIEPPSPPAGIELHPLAELDPRAVFELDSEAMLDVPGEVVMDDPDYEQWLEDYWRHPDMDLESSVGAVVDGRPVAFSLLRVTEDGRAVNDMTGTLHAHRGRGLALLVKRATLVNAAVRGVQFVTTDNDETNAPMLRVNEKLGYRPAGSRLSWSRP
jgi:GNAT superfamily N-acetyltransferase